VGLHDVRLAMNIREASGAYEAWLSARIRLIPADLRAKHRAMGDGAFPFLRATFYRWCQLWPALCPDLVGAPTVLAVGDLHLENFGTWRDIEGRLIWGVNDFDEACPMPYTVDLVRLATSAAVAVHGDHLSCTLNHACDALLNGYCETLATGGRPFVLAEHNRWLRNLALNKLRAPVRFWEKMEAIAPLRAPLPSLVKRGLTDDLPEPGLRYVVKHRRAGLGSLGRPRFTLIGHWRGGRIAREAKPLLVSAWYWAKGGVRSERLFYETIAGKAARVPDPFIQFKEHWVIRRLAPDCCRIELSDLPIERDELRLLEAMGRETANIHLGSAKSIAAVRRDLSRKPRNWLSNAVSRMLEATFSDWKEWRSSRRSAA
jgi:hypothetical protein